MAADHERIAREESGAISRALVLLRQAAVFRGKWLPFFEGDAETDTTLTMQGEYHEMWLAAVQEDGILLRNAAAPLQSNREIVLAAVKQDGHALH